MIAQGTKKARVLLGNQDGFFLICQRNFGVWQKHLRAAPANYFGGDRAVGNEKMSAFLTLVAKISFFNYYSGTNVVIGVSAFPGIFKLGECGYSSQRNIHRSAVISF